MKNWRCSLCGYIHTGDQPPDICPVSKTDHGQFVEVIEEATKSVAQGVAQAASESAPSRLSSYLVKFLYKNNAHPISVHFPNGVLPVTVIFVALAFVTGYGPLGQAAYVNLIAVFLTMPLVLLSGFISCKKRYKGRLTSIFVIKIVCAGIRHPDGPVSVDLAIC